MTLTTDIIQTEADELRATGIDQLQRNHNEYIRAAKTHLDCATVIQRFGPLPEGFCHAAVQNRPNHTLAATLRRLRKIQG